MKTREEQIEEMAYSVCKMGEISDYITDCSKCGYNDERDCKALKFGQKFYDAGYRKQSDTVREFVERLKKVEHCCQEGDFVYCVIDVDDIVEVAKEYGVEVEE